MWLLGIELWTSGRGVSALNRRAISPALPEHLLIITFLSTALFTTVFRVGPTVATLHVTTLKSWPQTGDVCSLHPGRCVRTRTSRAVHMEV
jgi:hypothetical protein